MKKQQKELLKQLTKNRFVLNIDLVKIYHGAYKVLYNSIWSLISQGFNIRVKNLHNKTRKEIKIRIYWLEDKND